MEFPQFETERLYLTELTKMDTADVLALFGQEPVVKYYDLAMFTEPSQAEQLIDFFHCRFIDKLGIRWAIRLKGTETVIGTCGYNSWNPKMKNAVIGYDLHPKFWGKGIITEAVARIIQAGFSGELVCGKLHRIQADTVPGNFASETVLKKLGFKEEGIRRQAGYWKNTFHDLKCFGLLVSEQGG